MNHLHFVQALDPLRGGGLGKAAHDLHESMIDLGEESILLTTASASDRSNDSRVVQLRRRGPDKAFFSPEMRTVAPALLDEADIVHGHGFYVHLNSYLGSAAHRREVPLVYHVHGMFEPWILGRSRAKKRVAHLLFEDRNFRYASLWRALTEREAGQIRAVGITAPIVVAPNGVDLDELDAAVPEPLQTRNSTRRRLLFLGRLHPKKGLDVLLPALSSIGSAFGDWDLVIAGPDEGGYETEVRTLIKTLDLETRVELIGEVRGAEKLAQLRSADALVLPSHSEGFPVTVLEAMASRLPVVVTRTSNIDGIEDRGAGIECDPTVASLERALLELSRTDDTELVAMGSRGRRWVEEEFTWSAITRTILDACQSELT